MTENKGTDILGSDHIGRLLLRLSVPAMIGMMVMALFNVVDTIFVGRGVGPLGIAGVTIVFPIQMFIMAIAQMIGIGGASIVSRALGSDDTDRAERTMGTMMLSALLIGTVVTIIGYLLTDPLLRVFGATDTILPYAREYLLIMLVGNVYFPYAVASNSVIRAEGRAGYAMITMLISAILNIILDPIFIFWLDMGVRGAAYATVIAKAVTAIWVTLYFFTGKSMLRYRLKNFRFHRKITGEIFAIGTSSFVRQVAASILIVIVNNILARLGGDLYIAVMGIVIRLMQFFVMPMFGVAQGLQPIAGYNYGAARYDKTKRAVKIALVAATAISIFGFLLLFFQAEQFLMLFTKETELIEKGIWPLRYAILLLPLVGAQVIGSATFQAIGKAVHSIVLSITRRALFLIPLLFVLPPLMGISGVWVAFPISDLLAFVLTTLFLIVQLREFSDKQRLVASKQEPDTSPQRS
ncbi:MAG TPA: MATE family efflux transporter [Spirochaetota bacterium]|nr:MATE family efflux transporter [Spirochaetota bacterium]